MYRFVKDHSVLIVAGIGPYRDAKFVIISRNVKLIVEDFVEEWNVHASPHLKF